MNHDGDQETAAKDAPAEVEAKPASPLPEPGNPNHMKRRMSGEGEGEKRLREDDDEDARTVTEGVTASPDADNDPQMQVSSLESDYNETPTVPAGVEEGEAVLPEGQSPKESHPESLPDDSNLLLPPPPPVPLPPNDFDVATKLQEMDEISVQSVSKTEAMKQSSEAADEEPVDEVSLTKKSKEDESAEDKKKNVSNLRKNIRDVIDDTMLDASTLAAQREEQERLNRVQEQQRALRALHRQTDLDKRQSSILSLLQGTLDPTDDPLAAPAVSVSAVRMLDKKTGQVLEEMPDQQGLEPGEIPNPALAAVQLKEAQQGLEVPEKKKEVVTIDDSSDDDCIMLSDEEEEPDGDDDPHNSGLHVNDTYNLPDDEGRVLINFGHSDTEQDVFVAPQIARALKPHQIGGIRFLYDNIIESLDRYDSSTGFGCILAHSMGLGKTLQLVCFCDIILRHTSAKTVLCIMPINTLQNWLAEFNWWLPEDEHKSPLREFGPVRGRNFKIHVLNDSQKTIAARSKVVLNWTKTGGVLLIGYELYRLLCLKKVVKKRGKRAERDPKYAEREQAAHGELLEQIYEALVKPGPDLVVCDEGHRIKSSHASTSVALKQIRTKRRVVLTGYPLQNNLLEYWCMVDFVRPNYLGTKTEFCNMFEKPIQNGQCIDSTPQDIKLMRYRAHVLHSLLLGFVQRRSHLVLQSTLPNKLEYVMLVRMTAFQRKLYDVFMNEVVRKKAVPNPLKAFAVCCKIWNHPDVLYNFLKKREADLDLELEEEMALAEAKKVRKEREKKAKEEAAAVAAAEAEREESERKVKLELQNGVAKTEQEQQSKMTTYQHHLPYGQANNAFASGQSVYNNSGNPLQGGGAYGSDPYGNSGYYSSPYSGNNHNSYHHQTTGTAGHLTAYDSHQYYSNELAGQGANGAAKDNKVGPSTFWGNHQYGSNNGYYDQQYSQNYTAPLADIPTPIATAAEVKAKVKEEGEIVAAGEDEDDDDGEGEDVKKKGKPEEKEAKSSSRDDGIPYEWAVELMKDYVPDLLENAPKMEIFFCILNESMAVGDRILVFSQSLLTLNLIERYLQKHKVPKKDEFWAKNTHYFRLDGSTTACDRERLINEFNTNEDVAIFLVSTRAGSLGINLVGANRVIVFDASWNPCHDTQAVCRVYRYGQKKQCYVYRMVMDNCLEKRIYDRQVNKQGMSDRVVDECNPDAHLSIKEVTNLCWDNDEETEVKDFSGLKEQYPDVVMQQVLEKYSSSLSKEPFRHESLLVDRKEKKLSMAEKRLAQRGYELEKQASTKTTYHNPGKVTQYRVFRTADGTLVHRPVGSVQSVNNSTSGTATGVGGGLSGMPISGGKWIPAEVWQQQGMTTQETTLPADVTIPSNSGDKNAGIVLKAGQKVMILKSSKGVYMQLESGKIIAIRTGPKPQPANRAPMNIPRPRGFGNANEVIKLDDDDDDEEEEVENEAEEGEINKKPTKEMNTASPKVDPVMVAKEGVVAQNSSSSCTSSEPMKLSSDHEMAGSQSSSSSGYFGSNNSATYHGSSANSSGSYRASMRQPQYDASPAGSSKTSAVSRDSYPSYPSSAYGNSRGSAGDYQQQQQPPQKGYNHTGHAVTPSSAQAAGNHHGQGGYPGSLYGSAGSRAEAMPTNGQYGSHVSSQQQQLRATVPPAYPQSGFDYSNRYYDQQSKALASQFNQSAAPSSHYPPPPPSASTSGYPVGQPAYPPSATYHHQYGQHRAPVMPAEYNPNNPPYYMNPYGASAAAGGGGVGVGAGAVSGVATSASTGAGISAYQPQGYGQDATVTVGGQQQGMAQDLLQQPQPQQYSDVNAAYAQQYSIQYNGPSAAAHLGKAEAPATEPHKKKEASSRRKGGGSSSESAFHKPTAAESVGVKVAEVKGVAEKKDNYYERSSGAFPSTYSPYNYPPSAYFYPGSYCAPPPPPLPEQSPATTPARDNLGKESKGRPSESKYYDSSKGTGDSSYQPPKW